MSIQRVALVGATGGLGRHFAAALLKTGKHTVTALRHPDSKGTVPEGIRVAEIDYSDEESLVSALKGQQFLAITLGFFAPPDTHSKLVHAAVKAGVPYIMPNVYGSDILHESLREEDQYGANALKRCEEIEAAGASYIAMVCGFWYEWCLAPRSGKPGFGIDIPARKAVLFDDGRTAINVSTQRQCGRALAALLSLPERDAAPSLAQWRNMPFYISSFRVSQRDMLDGIHRILGTTDEDWDITHETTARRYEEGLELIKRGEGRGKAMFARVFFPNGGGDYESTRGLANELIGLPEEDFDEITREAVELVEGGWDPLAQVDQKHVT